MPGAWGSAGDGLGFKSCNSILTRIETNDETLSSAIILPMKVLTVADVTRLCRAIRSNTNLRSLSASGHVLTVDQLRCLGDAIVESHGIDCDGGWIRDLAVGDSQMGNIGVTALLQPFVGKTNHLRELDLSYKNIIGDDDDGMSTIGTAFGSSIHLQRLLLGRNDGMKSQGLLRLCESASNTSHSHGGLDHGFPGLEYLDLTECGIGGDTDDDGAAIRSLSLCLLRENVFEQRPKLQLLLTSNPVGHAGVSSLQNLISTSTLSHLDLRNCRIGNKGLQALADALSVCNSFSKLESLDISQNGITAIPKVVSTSGYKKDGDTTITHSLTELNIAGNPLGPAEINTLLTSSLFYNPETLTMLDLSNTRCGIPGAVAALTFVAEINTLLTSSLFYNPETLTMLDLSNTRCGIPGAVAALTFCGQPNTALRELRLFNNKLGTEGLVACAPLLAGGSCGSLVHLDLGGNNAQEEGVAALLSAILEPINPASNETKENEEDGTELMLLEVGGNAIGTRVEELMTRIELEKPHLDVAKDRPTPVATDKLGTEGLVACAPLLAGGSCGSLVHLDLGGNNAQEEGVAALLSAILEPINPASNETKENEDDGTELMLLEVGGNAIGTRVEELMTRIELEKPHLDVAKDRPTPVAADADADEDTDTIEQLTDSL
eukprot:CAMPEP_0171322634 /NCGR_PEP_ID=MMETSP0816-20121228/115083_1 /TAXON_ID=420281 /ORGANISM="Proboscia inermis, Strain CCAP1064/1" /LENGTH=662 /DNA_ID=CAMNT_0011821163 /DNA_START=91 /DNA_END=2080 /DNA_ORIENTATION=+